MKARAAALDITVILRGGRVPLLRRACPCGSATDRRDRRTSRSEHRGGLTEHHSSSQIGRRIALRISRTEPRWSAPNSRASKAATLDAERLYEQAIRSARANGFVHNEALAYELAARFYAARGFEDIAEMYLARARDCYRRWGADGKVRQLDRLYPHLATLRRGSARARRRLPDPTAGRREPSSRPLRLCPARSCCPS